MHICFVNPPIEFYSPVSGGAIATILMQSARELVKHGHTITVLTPINDDPVYPVGTVVSIVSPIRENLPAIPRKLAAFRSRAEGWDWPYYQFYMSSFCKALRGIKQKPDVIIAFNDLVSPEYFRKASPGSKTVVWLQNEQGTRRKNLPCALSAIDKILTCSTYIRDYTAKRYALPLDRFAVVTSGVDLDAFSPAADFLEPHSPVRALFIGRIDPNKGPDIAADAVARLQAEGLNISLTVAGGLWFYGHGKELEDPYFQRLQQKMDAARANYAGYVTRPDVPALVRQHDVAFVLSRSNEPFGLVTLEAMASGCAVISSDRGGLPEACGGAAMLVDPEDQSQVDSSLRVLASDNSELNRWKRKAVERANGASWTSVGERLNSVLSSLVDAR